MNWSNIYSGKRTGYENSHNGRRTEYQRDFDRLIFSSAFRRLQNKTQVFPLPGSTFVHNRLTHSLEVASVGRSIGKSVGTELAIKEKMKGEDNEFYRYELLNVIASACLAHDIGNPAFGHSGEKAISNYFIENSKSLIEDKSLRSYFSQKEWNDFINFEGNANAFRVLTNHFSGKSKGGQMLTYSTLAAIMKYPCDSSSIDKSKIHRKKYNFFQADKETAFAIMNELNLIKDSESSFKRHPFVYLTEAADDICYRIVDFEDAQRLGILSYELVEKKLLELIQTINPSEKKITRILSILKSLDDENESISFLRAKCINLLVDEATDVFIKHSDEILEGNFNSGLIDFLEDKYPILKEIAKISINKIYNHKSVIEIEIAGFHILSDLLSLFIPAILKDKKSPKEKKLISLIPKQFSGGYTAYEKTINVLDYISGMTDSYAAETHKKLYGIETPKHYN